MFGAAEEQETDARLESAIIEVVEEALEVLNEFRAREGAELAAVIREQNHAIRGAPRR